MAVLAGVVVACSPTEPSSTGFDVAGAIGAEVAADSVMPWVERLAAAHLADTPLSCEGLEPGDLFPACDLTRDSAVALVVAAFASMGYVPDTVALPGGGRTAYNVVAEWPGSTRPDEVVLVASHLDAFFAGADDNGSAVAAMLEAARAVRGHAFARTIRFVAFDLEELGAVGSTRYVEAGYANDVVAAVVMDLVGYASHEPGSQDPVLGLGLPDTGDFLLVIGNEDSAELTQQAVALGNGRGLARLVGILAPGDGAYFLSSMFMRSDHGLLWYRGIPTIFLTDTGNFRNPFYHTRDDVPETLDDAFLVASTRAATAAAALFAEVSP